MLKTNLGVNKKGNKSVRRFYNKKDEKWQWTVLKCYLEAYFRWFCYI